MKLSAVAAVAAVAGCVQFASIENAEPVPLSAAQVAQIKSEVTSDFLDPRSAQFQEIRAVRLTLPSGKSETRVCGEVNGKNALGGYTGFSMFGGELVNGRFVQRDFFSPCEKW